MLARFWIAVVAASIVALSALPAHATYLGENGKIAYNRAGEIWVMEPDGSNQAPLGVGQGSGVTWSPDGAKIAYSCVGGGANTCTANADGSAVHVLDNFGLSPQYSPTWSPDGRRLAIETSGLCGSGCGYSDLWRIDAADGGDQIQLIDSGAEPSWSATGRIAYTYAYAFYSYPPREIRWLAANRPGHSSALTSGDNSDSPDWSPDATKIAFRRPVGNYEIYVMDAAGTNQVRLTDNAVNDSSPAWSPDGTKIVFSRSSGAENEIWVMNADGTGQTQLTNTPGIAEAEPAWQPVPQPGYARPRSASPMNVSLVPSFERCEEPNHEHGPPLAFGSCTPPDARAGFMTFGSAPAGAAPKSVGHVRVSAVLGDPATSASEADVRLSVSLTDVRRGFDLADGPGSLELVVPVRMTDKHNGALDSEQATVEDFDNYFTNPLRLLVPCVETSDPAVGSTCAAATTVNALFPWQPRPVLEGKRAIWQLDQLAVWDGGEDGYIESRDDNTVLAVQGVFVP